MKQSCSKGSQKTACDVRQRVLLLTEAPKRPQFIPQQWNIILFTFKDRYPIVKGKHINYVAFLGFKPVQENMQFSKRNKYIYIKLCLVSLKSQEERSFLLLCSFWILWLPMLFASLLCISLLPSPTTYNSPSTTKVSYTSTNSFYDTTACLNLSFQRKSAPWSLQKLFLRTLEYLNVLLKMNLDL